MSREYCYVGSADLLRSGEMQPHRHCVRQAQDVARFVEEAKQSLDRERAFVATFIVDTDGWLWIADRHSEHVSCARGQNVLAAGEITFTLEKQNTVVSAVTNQSTGYCPEPDSWSAVDEALKSAGLSCPAHFTTVFTFRRCPNCGTSNIVKEGQFTCGVCETALPEDWNYGRVSPP